MATYKRRIVYLSDEEWAWCSQRAKDHGNTVSAEIRGLLLGDWRTIAPVNHPSPIIAEPYTHTEPRTHTGHRDHPKRRTQQAARDAILRKINGGG